MPATLQVMLSQIAAWLPALDDAAHTATGLHSPHTALGRHSETGGGLPHHLAAILDTTDGVIPLEVAVNRLGIP